MARYCCEAGGTSCMEQTTEWVVAKAVSSQQSLVLPQLRKHLVEREGRMAQN